MSTTAEAHAATIEVSFVVNGTRTFEGAVPAHDVVHLALHRLLPENVRHNHRISVRKDDDLIYPDILAGEVDHYGDASFRCLQNQLPRHERHFTNYGSINLSLALRTRGGETLFVEARIVSRSRRRASGGITSGTQPFSCSILIRTLRFAPCPPPHTSPRVCGRQLGGRRSSPQASLSRLLGRFHVAGTRGTLESIRPRSDRVDRLHDSAKRDQAQVSIPEDRDRSFCVQYPL